VGTSGSSQATTPGGGWNSTRCSSVPIASVRLRASSRTCYSPSRPTACAGRSWAALVAQLVALELGCETYFRQRISTRDNSGLLSAEYRLPNSLCRRIVGKRVAIVDDVISAGSSVRATFTELEAGGARPVVVGSFLLMGKIATTWFAERGLGVEACARADIEIWLPGECPLCASRVPLEDVTVLDAGG
jgi:hypothetical protein